ncbi:hypothetical protein A3J23_01090 [Candidatus Peregrinibacteria bacterium RIFCSPLOWO2_02_FULL_48_14]|nr:MAG: hypothetical protein A3J23_01090 [Candidatus Peregrinibacteria bacterium RIFCSPLOWO2_02_FULL_48_14]
MTRRPENNTHGLESTASAFARVHRLIGTGKLKACESCRLCCHHGTVLLEGEELNAIPEGVELIGNRVKNCLGENGCKFPPKDKPLVCKVFPEVHVPLSEDGSQEVVHIKDPRCPARVPSRFREKVRSVISALKAAGIWGPKVAKLRPLDAQETRRIITDLANHEH